MCFISKPKQNFTAFLIIILLSILLITTTISAEAFNEKIGSVNFKGLDSFDSDTIANSSDNQWRWLSIPESRIVLNPSNNRYKRIKRTEDLPLNLGYYVAKQPKRLLDILMLKITRHSSGF